MAMAIEDSDSARGNDPIGGFHEESGVAGQVTGGAWIVSRDKIRQILRGLRSLSMKQTAQTEKFLTGIRHNT